MMYLAICAFFTLPVLSVIYFIISTVSYSSALKKHKIVPDSVGTEELKGQLKLAGYGTIQDQAFRKNIIGNLRDEGVIIASSSKGYKIPATKAELYDFVNRDAGIVLPMFSRLRKCRDLIKLGTFGEVDLLAEPEYKQLRKCIEALENEWT